MSQHELFQMDFHGSSSSYASEPFAHGLPCGKRVRWSSLGRRPTGLARVQLCQAPIADVNTIFENHENARPEGRVQTAASGHCPRSVTDRLEPFALRVCSIRAARSPSVSLK